MQRPGASAGQLLTPIGSSPLNGTSQRAQPRSAQTTCCHHHSDHPNGESEQAAQSLADWHGLVVEDGAYFELAAERFDVALEG